MRAVSLLLAGMLGCSGGVGPEVTTPAGPGHEPAPGPHEIAGAGAQAAAIPKDPGAIARLREDASTDLLAAAALVVLDSGLSVGQEASLLVDLALIAVDRGQKSRAVSILDLVQEEALDEDRLVELGLARARAGDVEPAMAIAVALDLEKGDTVRVQVVETLCSQGSMDAAGDALGSIGDPASATRAAVAMSACLAAGGDLEGAVKLASGIEDPSDRAGALLAVAVAAGDAGILHEARALAQEALVKDGQLLFSVALACLGMGDINSAWSVSKANPDPVLASRGLAAIALVHARAGNAFMAAKVCSVVLDQAVRKDALLEIMAIHLDARMFDEALDLLPDLRAISEDLVPEALCLAAGPVVEAQEHAVADDLVLRAGTPGARQAVRGCLAVSYARSGDAARSWAWADLLGQGSVDVLVDMASGFSSAGEIAEVGGIVEKLEGDHRDEAEWHLARGLVAGGNIQGALDLVPDILLDMPRARALLSCAAGQLAQGDVEAARQSTILAAGIGAILDVETFWCADDVWDARAERAMAYVSALPAQKRAVALETLVVSFARHLASTQCTACSLLAVGPGPATDTG